MVHLLQAALLFVQLLFMWEDVAGTVETIVYAVCIHLHVMSVFLTGCFLLLEAEDHRNITVFRGESVSLHCRTTVENTSQINWKGDKFTYAYDYVSKLHFSNSTSDQVQINIDSKFSTLNLLNIQSHDAGNYSCTLATTHGLRVTVWTLTVSENPAGGNSLYYLISVPGLLVCGIALTVCLWR